MFLFIFRMSIQPCIIVLLQEFSLSIEVTLHSYKTETRQFSGLTDNSFTFFDPIFVFYSNLKILKLWLFYRSTRQFTDINNLAEGYIFRNYNSFFREIQFGSRFFQCGQSQFIPEHQYL